MRKIWIAPKDEKLGMYLIDCMRDSSIFTDILAPVSVATGICEDGTQVWIISDPDIDMDTYHEYLRDLLDFLGDKEDIKVSMIGGLETDYNSITIGV